MIVYNQTIFSFIKRCQLLLKEIINQETDAQFARSRFLLNNIYYPVHLVCFEAKSRMGYFDPNNYQIGINQSLVYSIREAQLKDLLRHELAHYFTFIQYGDVMPHGKEFRKTCRSFNWGEQIILASDDGAISEHVGNLADEAVISKVQKLLRLAQSDNINESEQATIAANRILLKYNLDSVNQAEQNFYVTSLMSAKRRSSKMLTIYAILKHFNGNPILRYQKSAVDLEVSGNRTTVELCEYIVGYLEQELERLWQLQKLKGLKAKNSFFTGIARGYEDKFRKLEQQMPIQSKNSLILLKKQHQQILFQIYGRSSKLSSSNRLDAQALSAGHKAGQKLNINPGVKSSQKKQKRLL